MVTIMNDKQIKTLDDIRSFLTGTAEVEFSIEDKADRYRWIQATLVRYHYMTLGKKDRGLVLRFLQRVSGYSQAQIKRLVRQFVRNGTIKRSQRTVAKFKRLYAVADAVLLAQTDALHGQLSGAGTKKICERMYHVHAEIRYERLAGISVSHLYNLRHSIGYRRQRRQFNKTRPVRSQIGERRRPDPQGQPGFLRVDTVHQGDLDGIKGVYHINAVDEVTQFQCVFSVEHISERFLLPILEEILTTFPFIIQGFHADNGSEYINRKLAALLEKLRIELTKSRPRHSNDNALAESKNGTVIRKHFGYEHIPGKWAPELNRFHREHFNPYLNFHRPCFFPVPSTDNKGKVIKRYPYEAMETPYEKLKSLPDASGYLQPGVTFAALDTIALTLSDNEAARQMNAAKTQLFNAIFGTGKRVA